MVTTLTASAPVELVANTAQPSPPSPDETVVVFKKNSVTYLVESDGVTALRYAERCSAFEEMPEAEGCTTLPLSRTSVSLWQAFVSDSLSRHSWDVKRVQDLCTVAQAAEFLGDDDTLRECVVAVAHHLKTSALELSDPLLAPAVVGSKLVETTLPTIKSIVVVRSAAESMFGLKAIRTLHRSLQTAIFSVTDVQLPTIVHAVPPELLDPLLDRHLHRGVLELPLPPTLPPFYKHLPLTGLVTAVSSLPPLKGFTVSSGCLAAEDTGDLASILRAHAGTLQAVNMGNTDATCESIFASSLEESEAEVWKALAVCTSLTSMQLGDTNIHPKHTTAFCDMLSTLSSLQDIDLSGACNNLRIKMVHDVLPAVMSLSNLTRLSLSDNKLTRPACKKLCSTLSSLQNLRVLNVSRNGMRFEDAVMLFAVAATLPAVEHLIAEEMGFSESQSVASVYLGNSPCIFWAPERVQERATFFNALSEEGSEIRGSRQNSNSDSSTHPSSQSVHSVANDDELQSSIISNLRALKLKSVASTCASTRDLLTLMCMDLSLEASDTNFRVEAVELSLPEKHKRSWKPVTCLKHVTVLDLSHTPMSYEAMPRNTLENFVTSLTALQDLDLSNCYLPSSALKSLCECLCSSEGGNLKALNWSGNQALFEGALRTLCSLKSLETVALQDCGVAEARANELGKYIPQLENLVKLDLSRNWLRGPGINALAAGCSQLQALTYLHCGVSVGVGASLKQAQTILGSRVVVEMSGDAECNEWVMESWQVVDE